jgi:hypothetical protein
LFIGLGSFVVLLVPIVAMITARAGSEDRLLSDETIVMRFTLYFEYVRSLLSLPFFHGIFEDIWTTCDTLSISSYISSENIFIDTFVKNGLLTGIVYSSVWVIFMFLYIKIFSIIKYNKRLVSNEDFYFIMFFIGTFFSVFLMANTSLFEQVSFFWILFGLAIPVYSDLKLRKACSMVI